ncbi:MAG: hypothetical protein ACKVX7_10410 [Planctomycetota bacterium]
MSVVWSGILLKDDEAAARGATTIFADARVRQYFDPQRRVGEALAQQVGLESLTKIAERLGVDVTQFEKNFRHDYVHGAAALFDSIFFFAPSDRWDKELPRATAWVTQLDPQVFRGFDASRFKFGDELGQELARLAAELLARAGARPRERF